MYRVATTLLGLALILAAVPADAQVRILDEGSFTLYRNGDRVGREDFSIREAPGADGQVLVAQATVAIGQRRIAPGVNADTTGFPTRYQREVRDSGVLIETYSGVTAGGLYSSRLVSPVGESSREFRLPRGTVAADDDIIHQLWFITRRGPGATVPVLAPRRNAVDQVRVERVAAERISIDLREFQTTHLAIHTVATGTVRDVWVDNAGHIIKASIPAIGLVALRD